MTASELSEGPLESEASKLEQEVIQLATRRFLVSQACTRAGLVVGAGIGCSIAAFLDTHWYWALLGGISASVAVGVILKLFFRVVPQSDHEGI